MKFENVYNQYYKDVYYFLLSLCKDSYLGEELAQETFYKAFKSIHKFKGKCPLKSWLCKIARNEYLSWLKKQNHLSPEEYNPAIVDDANEMIQDSMVEKSYLQKEEAISIYKVLHTLDAPYKEVFTLRTLGDLSYKEIGEIFEQSEAWARLIYHRAKLKIVNVIREV